MSEHAEQVGAQDQGAGARHEPEWVAVRGVWLVAAGLLALMALSLVSIIGLRAAFRAMRGPEKLAPAEIRAEQLGPAQGWLNPPADLAKLRQSEDERLHGYRWIDRGAGVVHIPIERAMELVAQGRRPDGAGR